jgi:hypothetical protein
MIVIAVMLPRDNLLLAKVEVAVLNNAEAFSCIMMIDFFIPD